jgi:hypothetical protein
MDSPRVGDAGRVCPSCGLAVDPDASFCRMCGSPVGTPMEEVSVSPGEHGPVCPACGQAATASARFCNMCGASLESTPEAEPVLEPVPGEEDQAGVTDSSAAGEISPEPETETSAAAEEPAVDEQDGESEVAEAEAVCVDEDDAGSASDLPTVVCPACAAPQRAGAVFCGRCGHDLAASELQPAVAVEAGPTCPACGRPVRERWKACPYCSARLVFECPRCGQRAKPHWRVCPYCECDLCTSEEGG